jgi:hypothetical protein
MSGVRGHQGMIDTSSDGSKRNEIIDRYNATNGPHHHRTSKSQHCVQGGRTKRRGGHDTTESSTDSFDL